jgi:hypothetical protein
VAFLYVSDDMEWGRKNLKNTNGDLVIKKQNNDFKKLKTSVDVYNQLMFENEY